MSGLLALIALIAFFAGFSTVLQGGRIRTVVLAVLIMFAAAAGVVGLAYRELTSSRTCDASSRALAPVIASRFSDAAERAARETSEALAPEIERMLERVRALAPAISPATSSRVFSWSSWAACRPVPWRTIVRGHWCERPVWSRVDVA